MKKLFLITISLVLLASSACSSQGVKTVFITNPVTSTTTKTIQVSKLISPTITPTTPESNQRSPTITPEYHKVKFSVDKDSEYMFEIFVREAQTLHLSWFVKNGEEIFFQIITPKGIFLCFAVNGKYANGSLDDRGGFGYELGTIVFSPSDYNWGEGYYQCLIMNYKSHSLDVEAQYWIEN